MRLKDLLQEYREDYLDSTPAPGLDGFEALLQKELQQRQQRRQQQQRQRRIVLPIFAAAAALALAVLLPRPSGPARPSSSGEAPVVAQAERVASTLETVAARPQPVRRRMRLSQPIPPAPQRSWTEFVPLPQSRLLPEPDVLQVLRVSVSSERLAALGIAAPATYSESGESNVAAELLLGDDGLIRAVRVLR